MDKKEKKLSKGEQIIKNETSKTRTFSGTLGYIMSFILVFFSLLSIYIVFLSPFDTRINRASFVGMTVFIIYLLYPINQKIEKTCKYHHFFVSELLVNLTHKYCSKN